MSKLSSHNRFINRIKNIYSTHLVAIGVLVVACSLVIFSQIGNYTLPQLRIRLSDSESINQSGLKSESNTYKLIFAGDVMLARKVGTEILQSKFDPFSAVGDVMRSADLMVVNLECVVSDKGVQTAGKHYTFRADPRTLQVLQNAGVDAVSVANNHSGDFGTAAFSDMLSRLSADNIAYFGGGQNATEAYAPKYMVVRNLKVALLGFSNIETPYFTATASKPGIAWFEDNKVTAAIKEAKQHADLVIVVPHWGIEYTDQVSSEQVRLGHLMIDAGADLVIGSHPHHIQATETYRGKTILYSMGNFIFDGPGPNPDWYLGRMLEVDVSKVGDAVQVIGTKPLDYKSDNQGLPKFI